jgi:hypothetical protein
MVAEILSRTLARLLHSCSLILYPHECNLSGRCTALRTSRYSLLVQASCTAEDLGRCPDTLILVSKVHSPQAPTLRNDLVSARSRRSGMYDRRWQLARGRSHLHRTEMWSLESCLRKKS